MFVQDSDKRVRAMVFVLGGVAFWLADAVDQLMTGGHFSVPLLVLAGAACLLVAAMVGLQHKQARLCAQLGLATVAFWALLSVNLTLTRISAAHLPRTGNLINFPYSGELHLTYGQFFLSISVLFERLLTIGLIWLGLCLPIVTVVVAIIGITTALRHPHRHGMSKGHYGRRVV
jgi:hypothetical protein